jgi:hypothetical protein
MASRLAEIYRSEKKTGGGLGSSIGKSLKEKIDPRQMLDQSGLLVSMFPSLKSFNATRGKGVAEKVSSNVGGGIDNSMLNTLAATSSLSAKNSMVLPMMARDMNLTKLNIMKLVKATGQKSTMNHDAFWNNAKTRESAYENTIGKIAGKGMVGKMAKSALVGKQNRDGQSPESALFVTGGESSTTGGLLGSLGAADSIKKMASIAGSIFTSPLFLGSAAVLGTIALAKKLRDDELASNPEKYKNVPSNRAATEGTTNKTAGARSAAEARTGLQTLTKGTADDILNYLTTGKIIGQPATDNAIDGIVKGAKIADVLAVASDSAKTPYLKMVADNTPKQPTPAPSPTPTVLPASPAGAGRGFVNPENVSPTPQTQSDIPSNVIRSGSGAPIMTGSGGYVTSGEAPTSPSPMSSTATTGGTSPTKQTTATIGDAPGLPIDYKSYATKIGEKESGGKYDTVNSIGYVGKYQFGAMALEDMGLVKKGVGKKGQKALDVSDNWTISGGKQAFLNNAQLQEDTMKRYTMQNYKTLNRLGVVNKDSSPEQVAGYLASSHLLGPGGALELSQGKSGSDAYGTSAASYYKVGVATQMPTTSIASAPAASPSKPSSGSAVASASTSVADGKMAAMTPSGGNTNVTNKPTNVASNAPSSGGKASTAYDNELFQTLVGYQSVSA